MNFNGSARMNETFFQVFLFIAILTKPLFPLSSLEDDVNVASNEGSDLFSICGLYTVVLVLVVSKVQCEHIGWSCPPSDCCQWPSFQNFFCCLIQSQDGVFCDTQQSWNQFVASLLFLLRMNWIRFLKKQSNTSINLKLGYISHINMGLIWVILYCGMDKIKLTGAQSVVGCGICYEPLR